MKNKKTILSFIVLITGILCFIYYFTISNGNYFARAYVKIPFLMNFGRIIFLADAISLSVSGVIGLFTKNRTAKITMSCITLIVLAINCFITPTNYIVYPMLAVALISFLLNLIDTGTEKRVYLVMQKGDMLLTTAENRPTYNEVLAVRKKAELENPTRSVEKISRPAKTKIRRSRLKKVKGYAISPKSRYYRKKAKRKKSKR